MRSSCAPVLLLLAAACATPARLVTTADDRVKTVAQAADALAGLDVVVLGEQHDSAAVHRVHLDLLMQLQRRRGNLVLAMEMFERDVQDTLLQYLGGMLDEQEFLHRARPWQNYANDYRPMIEFARTHGIVVLAANAPRELAAKASKQGVAAVLGDPHVARTTTAPEDEYWDAFVDAMHGHVGTDGDEAMRRSYAAQCLKDDTMAESIVDLLDARQARDEKAPLVVLVAGQFHTDYRRGVVARLQSRKPGLRIGLVSAEAVDDLDLGRYKAPRSIADYVVVVQKPAVRAEAPPRLSKVAAVPPADAAQPAARPAPAAPAQPAAAPAGAADPDAPRPGLGLQPDYQATADGMTVDTVREGGAAAAAGIEPGDVVVELGGQAVHDVQEYTAVLGRLKIGTKVPVRIRRAGAEVVLQVLVAARQR